MSEMLSRCTPTHPTPPPSPPPNLNLSFGVKKKKKNPSLLLLVGWLKDSWCVCVCARACMCVCVFTCAYLIRCKAAEFSLPPLLPSSPPVSLHAASILFHLLFPFFSSFFILSLLLHYHRRAELGRLSSIGLQARAGTGAKKKKKKKKKERKKCN